MNIRYITPEILLEKIFDIKVKKQSNVVLVGIDGCGGSGKSTLSQKLKEFSSAVTVVEIDDFYKPSDMRKLADQSLIGKDFDLQRLFNQVINPLSKNEQAAYQKYNWEDDKLNLEYFTIEPTGVVIIEGVYSTSISLQNYYDYKVWVETSRKLRLDRGIERDGESSRKLWEYEWIPSEEKYYNVEKPHIRADIVLDGENYNSTKGYKIIE